jgi:IclR family transcriptional regulator, acetate operon repressor
MRLPDVRTDALRDKNMTEETEATAGKQVIARAAAVLRTLENRPGGVTQAQIACDTGLPRTTVQRIVQALEQQQLVCNTGEGVRLGPALTRLAASTHTDLIALARPHIEAAGRHTRETVHLSVERGEHAVLVDQYVSDHTLRVVSPVGTALPLYCTSHGKALLAQWSDAEVARRLGEILEPRTSNTLTSAAELLAQLHAVRAGRVAENREEQFEGVCGLGAFVRSGTTDRYALSIVAPVQRFERKYDALRASLLRCVSAIEASLGHVEAPAPAA